MKSSKLIFDIFPLKTVKNNILMESDMTVKSAPKHSGTKIDTSWNVVAGCSETGTVVFASINKLSFYLTIKTS